MKLAWLTLLLFALGATGRTAMATEPAKRPMQIEDLFKFARVSDPQVSPDGKQVVYVVGTVDLAGNKSSSALYLAPTDGSAPPKQLTNPLGKKDFHPRWRPDGGAILFESTRAGVPQLFLLSLGGGEAVQLTTIKTGASVGTWSGDGKHIAFMSSVFPEFSTLGFADADAKNAAKQDEREKSPVKAKVFTKLFYRHWDSYVEDKRNHLFVCEADGKLVRNVTPGDRDAYPNSTTFSVGDDFTFTPDGKHLVFAAAPAEKESWSTNYELCRVGIENTSTKWEVLTGTNPAADNSPKFSPDGKTLAWRSQKKAGYEADKWDIMAVDVSPSGTFAGPVRNLTKERDISNHEIAWAGPERILFTADANGLGAGFTADLDGNVSDGLKLKSVEGRPFTTKFNAGTVASLSITPDGKVCCHTLASIEHPAIVAAHLTKLTPDGFSTGGVAIDPSEVLLKQLDLPKPESVKVSVEGGDMQMWLLKPPGFDESKKYPVVYLVHGGPQGMWGDSWSYRWNPQLWAAQGYVVAMPNPRGSTGFGQKFVDEISGDWGGKCYRDLEAGLNYVTKLKYVDPDRIGSAGASFGGYMQNWFAVSPIAKKFKCLITHCSVWNFESMWGTTDELWFDEYEHGGLPWEVPGKYAEFSPHKLANKLGEYKVPMLVVHNDLDFRCPIGQGHELFTALQRQGVPSRMVNFPDEGHWVLKPQNSVAWHREVFAWLTKYVEPGGR